jgi:hypothetical protein
MVNNAGITGFEYGDLVHDPGNTSLNDSLQRKTLMSRRWVQTPDA